MAELRRSGEPQEASRKAVASGMQVAADRHVDVHETPAMFSLYFMYNRVPAHTRPHIAQPKLARTHTYAWLRDNPR